MAGAPGHADVILTIPSRSRQAIKGRMLRMTHRSTRNQDLDKPAQQYQLGPGRRRTTSGKGVSKATFQAIRHHAWWRIVLVF